MLHDFIEIQYVPVDQGSSISSWLYGSMWGSPDNKYLWCPSGQRLRPGAIFKEPINPYTPSAHQLSFFYVKGNFTFKYQQHAPSKMNKALCEQP
jgi:hypothetical protein